MASSSSSPRTSPPTVSLPLDVPTRPPLEGPNSDSSISTVASTSSSYSFPSSDTASFMSTSSGGLGGEHPYSKLVIINRSASPFDENPFDTMLGVGGLGYNSSASPAINLGSHSIYAPRSASTYPPTTAISSSSGQTRDFHLQTGTGNNTNLLPLSQANSRTLLHPHSLASPGTEKSDMMVETGAREVDTANPRSTGAVESGGAESVEEVMDALESVREGKEESFSGGALAPVTASPLSLSPGLTPPLRQASLPCYNRPMSQYDTFPTSTPSPITSSSVAPSPLINSNKTPARRQSLPALITTNPSLSSNHSRSPQSSSTISSLPHITPQTESKTTFRSSLISASPAESHPPSINQARPTSTSTFNSSSGSGSNSSSCGSGSGSGMSGGGTGGGIGGSGGLSGASYWTGTNSGGMYGSGGGSSRPWVRDSDASSVYSGGSWGSGGAGMSPAMVGNFKDDASLGSSQSGDAEVLKVDGDGGIAFLDPRPEPVGAKLTIFREDLDQVVIKVVLPGFSLDNITVAMRRGHKIHIVADSWGENGGHFEKLISLGSDASSSAPRAEFNGTDLYVYVQRRISSRTIPPTSLSNVSSPNPSTTSSGIMSPSLAHSPPNSTASPTLTDAPIATRSTATSSATSQPASKRNSKSLTGPEGAKVAAKAAKEEAARRAKEVAKTLPKLNAIIGGAGVRSLREGSLPLLPAAETGLGLGLGVGFVEREGPSIEAKSTKEIESRPTSLPLPTKSDNASSTSVTPATPPALSYAAPSTATSTPSTSTSSSKDLVTPTATPRPKLPGSNQTIRPTRTGSSSGNGTFLEAAMGVATDFITGGGGGKSGEDKAEGEVGEALTPKVEKMGFFSRS